MKELDRLANTIRFLAADAVQQAKSGHPGMPMGAADMASVLWAKFLRFDPKNPQWLGRDRFVLSAGHGSMLLYSLLHLFGFPLSLQELKNFRQWESKTPGHPEFGWTPGVETTTGPLGQGFANGVGFALSSKMLAARYETDLVGFRVFGIVSDGDLMEGVTAEAASLAGHLKLGNMVYLYDDNHISIGGGTEVSFTESVPKRFEAYGWHVQAVDGHNKKAVSDAIQAALQDARPSIICCRTTIGFGSPNMANTAEVHGAPLGEDELRKSKEALGWPADEKFLIPEDVQNLCENLQQEKQKQAAEWQAAYAAWREKNPALAVQLDAQLERELPVDLEKVLLAEFAEPKKEASRSLSERAIQVIAKHVPSFLGGSADLEPSTKTLIKGSADIQAEHFTGKNLRFGVREHAMGSIANGLAYERCWIPYTATFLVFADYMRPPIRLAALSHLQSLFIFTHDSFWVGEDGPTHQPIEQIESLRLIPNLYTYRPADGLEVAASYLVALERKSAPSALLFTRQNLTPLVREVDFSVEQVRRGGYVVAGESAREICVVATGSEVDLAIQARAILAKEGIALRVVSIPCLEAFLEQDLEYRESVVPPMSKKISIEAGRTYGWRRVVGEAGLCLGIDHYGASAPGELLAEKFGFTGPAVADRIRSFLK